MASRNLTIYAALAANLTVAVAKFVAAAFTGSSAMVAEGIHSLVDISNGLMLLWGIRISRQEADEGHPFGHGKEQYFWTLIVAVLMFALGGGFSIFEGIERLLDPQPIKHPFWNYAVLLVAAISDGFSFVVAFRRLRATRPDGNILQAARASKDPSTFAILFEDFAALLGVAVAFAGVLLSHWLESSYPDGIASGLVGLILAAVALLLAYESKRLLVGESAEGESVASTWSLVEADPAVARAGRPLTMHLGPEDVLLNLDVQFHDGLSTAEIIKAVDRLEQSIRAKHPEIRRIYIEAESFHERDVERVGSPSSENGETEASAPVAPAEPQPSDG